MDVPQLQDKLEIHELLARYARGVDTEDWDLYNPVQLPGMADQSYCGGYYHHELTRTPDGWRSRSLREENVWFVNPPTTAPSAAG